MRYFIIFSLALFVCACVSMNKDHNDNTQTFCQKKYGADAQFYWVISGVPLDQGKAVADKISGFQCIFNKAEASKEPNVDCKYLSEKKLFACSSQNYKLKELCSGNELKKYWDDEDFFNMTCSKP